MDLIDRDELEDELQNSCNDYSDAIHVVRDMPTVDAVPLSVIEEIKAEIIEMRKRDPLYYYVSTEDILDWVLNTIDRKVKEHKT